MTSTALMRLCVLVACAAVSSCTVDHWLQGAPPNQPRTLALERPLDVLFVVDNSASMAEEHAELYRSVFNDACPIVDVRDVPARYQRPDRVTFDNLAAVCGLSQLLAALGGDFHLGVITTDVGLYDERMSQALDPQGLHEQTAMRGCLQGKGVITSDDDIATTFAAAINGVGTYGSVIERGLDAVEVFLDPNSRRAPGCENDLDGFLRPDGRLLVVFVTDEDDCSHRDGRYGFPDELANEPQRTGDFPGQFRVSASACTSDGALLAPVQSYQALLARLVLDGATSDVLVGVIGGAVAVDGQMVAAGCITRDDGSVSAACTETGGTATCTDDVCCSADSSDRYIRLARLINEQSLVGSICSTNFLDVVLPLFRQDALGGEDVFRPVATAP